MARTEQGQEGQGFLRGAEPPSLEPFKSTQGTHLEEMSYEELE